VKNFYVHNPEMAKVPEAFVRRHVMMMHEVFFNVRIGGAQKGIHEL
jgi:hypothetical protein